MRRKDRELMPEEAWEIVDRCADGVVSMVDDAGAPYAVPVNLVREDNRVYFHSAVNSGFFASGQTRTLIHFAAPRSAPVCAGVRTGNLIQGGRPWIFL